MKDEMQKPEAMQGNEVKEEELQQATGGVVLLYGDNAVTCPNCGEINVEKSRNPAYKYHCILCNWYFPRKR